MPIYYDRESLGKCILRMQNVQRDVYCSVHIFRLMLSTDPHFYRIKNDQKNKSSHNSSPPWLKRNTRGASKDFAMIPETKERKPSDQSTNQQTKQMGEMS